MNESKGNILLAEDEIHLHESLKLNLEMEGYSVTSAYTGTDALKKLQQEYINLLILDIMLPEMDGLSVLEAKRVHHSEVPVLILSAKNSGADKVAGLKKGADDYLTKPFHLEELLVRVEKLVMKNLKMQTKDFIEDTYSFGNNTIDFKAQTAVTWNGKIIELSKKEAMLLRLLIENKDHVVTREKILQVVWGYNVYPTTRTIDNFILSFRKYFEEDSRNPRFFHSIRGVGYKYLS